MTNASWRITFPIEKAEARDDGLYITGLASGPEIDSSGERMEQQLVYRFAEQINARGDLPLDEKLVYRDAHAPDGVLRDLGWLTRAWVNEEGRLAVEVRLDEANPAATYLYRNITQRGKKYGMSVAGKVLDFADEFVSEVGKTVRTYRDVVLTEISNTTRPAWTPSFGSVLSKAIDEAAAESGATEGATLVDNETLPEQSTEAPADETQKADEQPEAAETTEETTEKADEATESADEDVEKAGRKFSAAAATRLIGMYTEMGNALKELGVLEADSVPDSAEKADSQDNGDTVAKSEDETPSETAQLLAAVEELRKSNAELTAKVEELEKRPATVVPPVVERAITRDDFMKSIADLSPTERMRLGFAALHNEGSAKS